MTINLWCPLEVNRISIPVDIPNEVYPEPIEADYQKSFRNEIITHLANFPNITIDESVANGKIRSVQLTADVKGKALIGVAVIDISEALTVKETDELKEALKKQFKGDWGKSLAEQLSPENNLEIHFGHAYEDDLTLSTDEELSKHLDIILQDYIW